MKDLNSNQHLNHCHCGFHRRLLKWRTSNGRKLGLLGVTLFTLHFLFHVAECLVLPAILVGFQSQISSSEALAVGVKETEDAVTNFRLSMDSSLSWNFYEATEKLGRF